MVCLSSFGIKISEKKKKFKNSSSLKKTVNPKEMLMTWIWKHFFQGGFRIRIRIKMNWILCTSQRNELGK